jgi:2-isopropylmalate synthase
MLKHAPELASSRTVRIYDTSLRDGTQREGISLTVQDKLRIARRLDAFGVHFIEGGWPGSNPKDAEFFACAKDIEWQSALIAAFGSTRRAKVTAAEDPSTAALVESAAPICTIFGKSWTLHVTEVLRTTLDDNLAMIEDTVSYLVAQGRRVMYDAEHFFDGYTSDSSYALETLRAAKRGGAEVLVLCDTNGGGLPWRIEEVTRAAVAALEHPIGIHAHDDTGCAVANSLAAVRGGARQVQGTVNGYGERCGNANLTVVVPNLELKMGLEAVGAPHLAELTHLSKYVAERANVTPDHHMPYAGKSAFAHKGGVHVAAMRRAATSYQHVEPELVGNEMRVVISELSGRANVLSKAEELGVSVDAGSEVQTLQEIKDAESRGMSYESAEASVALLLLRRSSTYRPLFRVLDYQVMVGQRQGTEPFAEAVVKVQVGNQIMHTAAEGTGPVSALDAGLRKALSSPYPAISGIHLADYKVRILDGAAGTASVTRVLIDSHTETREFTTVGASENIIEASMQALVDSIEYGLLESGVTHEDALDGSVHVTPNPSSVPKPVGTNRIEATLTGTVRKASTRTT